MYLVFDLPASGDNYPSAHTIAFWLHREIDEWSKRYQIEYKTKFHKSRLRLIFASDDLYFFFMVGWNPNYTINNHSIDPKWSRFTVINPPKH